MGSWPQKKVADQRFFSRRNAVFLPTQRVYTQENITDVFPVMGNRVKLALTLVDPLLLLIMLRLLALRSP
jgi:hypothetical protein